MNLAEHAVEIREKAQELELKCCNPVCRLPITEEKIIYDSASMQIYHTNQSCFGEGYRWVWSIRGIRPEINDYKIISKNELLELKERGKLTNFLEMPKG